MKHKPGAGNSTCNVISFKNYKDKKVKYISSTIAAIVAINIEHPSDAKPEDFFINKLEGIKDKPPYFSEAVSVPNGLAIKRAEFNSLIALSNPIRRDWPSVREKL